MRGPPDARIIGRVRPDEPPGGEMATTTLSVQKRSIEDPTEVREFEKGRIDIVELGETLFARTVFQPGWRWSDHVKPIVQTELCQFHHKLFLVSGSMHVRMADGIEADLAAGDVADIAPGHDAWVTGDEACLVYDFGEENRDYAKPAT
jgi:hypothetical protein